MSRDEHSFSDLLIYAIAFSLAAAIVFAPQKARSGSYTADASIHSKPRWSNEHHVSNPYYGAATASPDCIGYAPGASPEYVAGVDAWGRPVSPAEGYGHYAKTPLPVEVDVLLKHKRTGKRHVGVTTGPITLDAANNMINGYPVSRDCAHSIK